MSKMKISHIVFCLLDEMTDRDCVDIVKVIFDNSVIQKKSTIFEIEKIVKSVADYERSGV